LRLRDDIGTRELVLVMLAAAGSARTSPASSLPAACARP
jgi:hypothetical protein